MTATLTPSFQLTTKHPASYHGIPVLYHRRTGSIFRPADVVRPYQGAQLVTAAKFVVRYGKRLSGDERKAAENFLRQWPDGPQLASHPKHNERRAVNGRARVGYERL